MVNASVPVMTAINAAKPKGFQPTLAISLNLTLKPTPAKDMANRKGIMGFRFAFNDIHVAPRMGFAIAYESRPAHIIEFMMNITANSGATYFVFCCFSCDSNLFR